MRPESRRLCYIGPDYRAGGRLAAEYIGKTLLCMRRPRVLVLTTLPDSRANSRAPDINALRYEGFCAVMDKHFPGIAHDTAYITKGMRSPGGGAPHCGADRRAQWRVSTRST